MPRWTARRLVLRCGAPALAAGLLAGSVLAVLAQDATPAAGGQLTAERPFLVATDPAALEIVPLISSGEMVGDYQMAGVPDGLGAFLDGDRAIVLMNHELTPEEDENLSGARISRLVMDPKTGAVLEGSYAVDGTEGFERFCSAFLAGAAEGFAAPTYLTGEEGTSSAKGGLAVAVDGMTGAVTELPWLGYLAHENVIAVPGFEGKTVVLTTDDDSTGSELYMYVADSGADVLAGKGQLSVFTADAGTGAADLAKGATLTGSFIPVDQKDNADAATLQAAVEKAGAFRFIRLEDATFDPAAPNVLYIADTGDNEDPNLDAAGTPVNANGRIFRLELDPADPTKVVSLQTILDGDAGDDFKNPDNLAARDGVLVIQEDRNGYNRFENSEDTGRILAYDIAGGTLSEIARLDQSAGDGMVDEGDKAGSWESSGIIDASEVFGPGAWLAAVQAHTMKVDQFGGTDEGGQLLLLRSK